MSIRKSAALVRLPLIVALVAGLAMLAPSSAQAATRSIKVSTYNICAEKCPGLKPWKTRSTSVVRSIAAGKPDVVLVQEAGRAAYEVKTLVSRMKAQGYALAQGRKARYLFIRSATMSVYRTDGKRLQGGTAELRGTSSSRVQYYPWQVVRKKNTQSRTLVADLHLSVGKTDAIDQIRLAELTNMFNRLKSISRTEATIFGGDFNSLADDADPTNRRCGDYSVRWRTDAFMQKQGYLDAVFKTASLRTPAVSTVNANPTRATYECAGQQIDHLYSDRRLSVASWETNERPGVAYADQYSDHDMVTAVFNR